MHDSSYESTADAFLALSKHRFALIYAVFSFLRWQLLAVTIPRAILIAFNYAQPFLISRCITYLYQAPNDQTANYGRGLIGATALIYLGLAVSFEFRQASMADTIRSAWYSTSIDSIEL